MVTSSLRGYAFHVNKNVSVSQNENRIGTDHPNGPESNVKNTGFTSTNDTQSLAGANCDEMQVMDFLTALFCGWEKVICIVQKFRRLLMNDGLSKHSIEHCHIGLFG